MLEVITNDKVRNTLKTQCTVKMDKRVDTFSEFVTVGYNAETGNTTILQNADALTLGRALIMIAKAFNESMNELDYETKTEVRSILYGGAEQ